MRGTFIMSVQAKGSLSARRAWIEIIVRKRQERLEKCRSPQGERG